MFLDTLDRPGRRSDTIGPTPSRRKNRPDNFSRIRLEDLDIPIVLQFWAVITQVP